jgi:hypothetical protein
VIVGSYSPEATAAEINNAIRQSPLVASALDGAADVYWRSGSWYAFVLTHLPGRLAGFVQVKVTGSRLDHRGTGPTQVMQALTSVWRSSVRGVALPAQTAWRSQPVAPGGRTALACGLSMVMPHRWPAELASSAVTSEPLQMFMPLTLHAQGWYGQVLSLRGESDKRLPKGAGNDWVRLVARSTDGRVTIYGERHTYASDAAATGGTTRAGAATPNDFAVVIVTRLPGHAIGMFEGHIMTSKLGLSRTAARRFAQSMWTAYQVRGVTLPPLKGK